MQFRISLAAGVLAGLIAACSGQNSTSLLPGATSGSPPVVAPVPTVAGRAITGSVSNPLLQTLMQGTITSLKSGGGFTLRDANGSGGYVPVTYPPGTPINTYLSPLEVGRYAVTVGTGSSGTGEVASYVVAFVSAPGVTSVTGTLEAMTAYGMVVKNSTSGSVPILLYNGTHVTGALTVGATVTVTGNGSTGAALLASSVTSGVTQTPTPTPTGGYPITISQKHLVTGDYLGTPWGTTKVSASQAAPYLSWAETDVNNTNVYSSAGMKTEVYFSPDRVQTNDPLYHLSSGSEFAETCPLARVWDKYGSIVQYLMNPESSSYRAAYGSYVASVIAGHPVNAIFEDNGTLPSHFLPGYFTPSMPCGYSDSAWISGEKSLEAAAPIPTIINGLNGLQNEQVSPLLALMTNPKTMGGSFESCISNIAGNPNNGVWVWQDTENSQIQVLQQHKTFQCMGLDKTAASSSYAPRTYMLASFLMTYDPNNSIFWESYGTASGLSVMPESQFVALYPLVAQPSAISQLKTKQGPYVRAYHACYYAGKLIGPCEMVVNSDYYAESTPPLYTSFHHTLAVSGNGILDGGTASMTGAAPPSTMAGETGFIALP